MQQHDRSAEALGRIGGGEVRDPAPGGSAQPAVPLPGGEVAELVPEPDDIQGAQGVRGQRDAGAHRIERAGPLQNGDLAAGPVQSRRSGQPSDTASYDDDP